MSSSNFQRAIKIAKRKKYLTDKGYRQKADNRKKNKAVRQARKQNR